jgi:hypothetical protein
MSMKIQFPFLPSGAGRDRPIFMPWLPVELRMGASGEAVRAHGLLDSGAAVSVIPYNLGVRLGANWDQQTTPVRLTGNLAAVEARALLLEGRVTPFPFVELVFAWTRADNTPLLLGQVNFFHHFRVCFHRRQLQFELEQSVE